MTGGEAAGNRSGQQLAHTFKLPKDYLPFSSSRPPFFSHDEYHRFDRLQGSNDEMVDALVLKTPVSFWWSFVSFCSY